MIWYKARWIDPLFAAFNARSPGRPKGSDGTIGDLAHQSGASGHNPDDTPGVRAERSDADSKPEVRAADVTTVAGMQAVIDAILRTPADRDRFVYIIFNRQIWRKSNGWRRETYTGSDPHTGHAHFSGDPDHDENGAPFTSILLDATPTTASTGDDMQLGDKSPWDKPFTGEAGIAGPWLAGTVGNQLQYIREDAHFARALAERLATAAAADEVRDKATLAAVEGLVAAIKAGGGSIDAAPIVAAVNAVRDEARREFAAAAEQAAAQDSRIADLEEQLARAVAVAEVGLSPAELDRLNKP